MDKGALLPASARTLFREGHISPTAGWCDGYVQANIISVPKELAWDMLLFAQRNPRACPVLDVLDVGKVSGPLASGDIRTDLPLYRVYVDGVMIGEFADVSSHWMPDLVTFLIGCSFTFDRSLIEAGVPVRHVEQKCNVSMYRTGIACREAGALRGPLIVSMRPIPSSMVDLAIRVTKCFPQSHGAPVHVGDPRGLGISSLDCPDYGDVVVMESGDTPVFWACGVTPQAAIEASRPPFAISHSPGHMLITDVAELGYRLF